uniref:Leucine rich repeat containing 2 n=1 Tax=Acanthochromis polyacanthus TaxID=80966 RepID=A0A3Q1GWP2_9TELE
MGLDVPVYDLSVIRGLWEVRAKKHRQKQKKEQERKEKSALTRIEQEWQYRIYCKSLKSSERNLLHHYLERSTLTDVQPHSPFVREVLQDFPRELQWMSYLEEWHVRGTRIRQLPDFLPLFTQLTVLQIPKNCITELPPEIGEKTPDLNPSDPPVNLNPSDPPVDLNPSDPPVLSGLKRLLHLDIAENRFISIPICALRMFSLQLLDLSSNQLTDLPQDMDRLDQLVTLLVHKNHLTYLPHCLTNIPTLKMVVVSGDELTCVPTRVCSNPDIKRWRQQQEEKKDGREKEFMEAYISSLKDRGPHLKYLIKRNVYVHLLVQLQNRPLNLQQFNHKKKKN